ncbi:lytic murein transglycosylase B [Permianibacter sp. IMCC34836]|uniref:lytic murein transglycosylase B n=1 Tax=Permianibacter fluminis TaxID=2738515 RepID=UPI001556B689|nr:lytic murein transglycosylase B [Permianibacter fluminis]NQD36634.1 lytic murein transglycosylase B [Permianibacter fluminis]
MNTQCKLLNAGSVFAALLTAMVMTGCTPTPQQQFAARMQTQYGIDKREVEAGLQQAEKKDDIIALMTKPAEAVKPWKDYAPIFLTDARRNNGVAFWREHADTLAKAEQQFGVPAEYIVAIIGVETNYGRIMGKHRVLDALNTLAFYYPPRSPYFTGELEQFFVLAREQNWDLTTPMGSYAGAMGMGQFMPTSYRKWAVDFDGDGQVNLFQTPADAIGSVGNYFRIHGWQTGGAMMLPVSFAAEPAGSLLYPKRDVAPLNDLFAAGMQAPVALQPDWQAALLVFDEADGRHYYLGFNNFRVITRYNKSPLYARAVLEFAGQLKAAYLQPSTATATSATTPPANSSRAGVGSR